VHARVDAVFTRHEEGTDVWTRVPAYFILPIQDIDGATDYDTGTLASEFDKRVENFEARGSGFVIERVVRVVLCISKFRPLHGRSYVPTPKRIAGKHCVVNVMNDDQRCFIWAILSALYTPKYNKERVYNYRAYENKVNVDGLSFPLPLKEIPKFENLNPTISVNVLSLDDGGFVIEYLSPHRGRQHHINLLLLDEQDEDNDKDEDVDATDRDTSKRHYVWIKNMSRLVAGRT